MFRFSSIFFLFFFFFFFLVEANFPPKNDASQVSELGRLDHPHNQIAIENQLNFKKKTKKRILVIETGGRRRW